MHLLPLVASLTAVFAASPVWPDLEVAPPGTHDGSGDAAAIIAVEDYAYLADIGGARRNATDWLSWLVNNQGLAPTNIVSRYDSDAVDWSIRAALSEAQAKVAVGGTLWVVYIGHGAPSVDGREALLVGADAQATPAGLVGRSVPASEVTRLVGSGAQARTVIVLDACFSGQGTDGADLVEEPLAPVRPVATWRGGGAITVMTATSPGEFAGLLPGEKRPAFSYLVLGGLRGWADANGDGAVMSSEIVDYARGTLGVLVRGRQQVPQHTGPVLRLAEGDEQGPALFASAAPRPAPVVHRPPPGRARTATLVTGVSIAALAAGVLVGTGVAERSFIANGPATHNDWDVDEVLLLNALYVGGYVGVGVGAGLVGIGVVLPVEGGAVMSGRVRW